MRDKRCLEGYVAFCARGPGVSPDATCGNTNTPAKAGRSGITNTNTTTTTNGVTQSQSQWFVPYTLDVSEQDSLMRSGHLFRGWEKDLGPSPYPSKPKRKPGMRGRTLSTSAALPAWRERVYAREREREALREGEAKEGGGEKREGGEKNEKKEEEEKAGTNPKRKFSLSSAIKSSSNIPMIGSSAPPPTPISALSPLSPHPPPGLTQSSLYTPPTHPFSSPSPLSSPSPSAVTTTPPLGTHWLDATLIRPSLLTGDIPKSTNSTRFKALNSLCEERGMEAIRVGCCETGLCSDFEPGAGSGSGSNPARGGPSESDTQWYNDNSKTKAKSGTSQTHIDKGRTNSITSLPNSLEGNSSSKLGSTAGTERDTELEEPKNAWTINRKDLAWFIAKKVVCDWDEWRGRAWTVTY